MADDCKRVQEKVLVLKEVANGFTVSKPNHSTLWVFNNPDDLLTFILREFGVLASPLVDGGVVSREETGI